MPFFAVVLYKCWQRQLSNMFQALSVLILIAAVCYFTPEHVVDRRAPTSMPSSCSESVAAKAKCGKGNALVFYNGPSAHTVSLLAKLKMLGVKGTFIIDSNTQTDWTIVKRIVDEGNT